MGGTPGVWLALGMVAAQPDVAADPEAAVRYAQNAFEYRDFDKTVEVLWPWLHPPKIVDEELLIEARELLGVALHQVGRLEDAEEEFAALLLLSPDHRLDPFVVPPDVIARFEGVKEQMEPRLKVLREREPLTPSPATPQVRVELRLIEVPHWSLSLAPFGIPQFVLDRPAWGATLSTLQVVGLGLNIAGFARGDQLAPDSTAYESFVALQYAGLSVAVVAYITGIVHAQNVIREQREAALAAARDLARDEL